MAQYIAGLMLGLLVGMLAAIPGVHVSVLLIALLPVLGLGGEAGAVAITTAVGSGLVATTLAKTFHPATTETIKSATPEQLLAYQGHGLEAINIQVQATWTAVITVTLISIPLMVLKLVTDTPVRPIIDNLMRPVAPVLLIIFFVTVFATASKKTATLFTMVAASTLGFYAMHHPGFQGNTQVLTPLLGGLFALPTLLLVVGHPGKIAQFPQQLQRANPAPTATNFAGALGGVTTALTAGLGSGAAVSLFASKVSPRTYLGMNTAAEAANNAFAIILFITAGLSRSGSAVALKQDLYNPGLTASLLLLTSLFIGLTVATNLVRHGSSPYAKLVSKLPQRVTAAVVAVATVTIAFVETGHNGLVVLLAATAVGLAAKQYYAPNQALIAVLAGPVLIYQLGLSQHVATLMGLH